MLANSLHNLNEALFGPQKSTSQPGRSLTVSHNGIEMSFYISLDLWSTAERIRDSFHAALSKTPDIGTTEIDLYTAFLRYCCGYNQEDKSLLLFPFLKFLLGDLNERYAKGNDIHAISLDASLSEKMTLVRSHYELSFMLNSSGNFDTSVADNQAPALVNELKLGRAKLFAIFGGQGNSEEYLMELRDVYSTYHIILHDYCTKIFDVLNDLSKHPDAHDFVSQGFNVLSWLEKPESQPSNDYLLSTPISLPLLGLIQLINYYVLLQSWNISPHELRNYFEGTTGHSQGIISSVVISSSSTIEEFFDNSIKGIKLLFWIGIRSLAVFPQTTLDPSVIKDSVANNEGIPTPMLAVSNLSLKELEKQVHATNAFLKEDQKIYISLVNGPHNMVCSGPPQSLYGLNVALRKFKAPAGLDQSRIPFSERKVKFSTRFLPIGAPFHSAHLLNALPYLNEDIKRFSLDFKASSMALKVLSTDTGENIASLTSISASLIEQICVKPVFWENATNFHDVTHAIDFGPGQNSGIGALTQRNKEGSGLQVILAGCFESSNSSILTKAALFDRNQSSLKYGANWKVEYQPKLVKSSSGKIFVDTKFSRLLGKPHLMVAGMTPATVNSDFTSACINAGFHVELGGGGLFMPSLFKDTVEQLISKIPKGERISVNVLFLNARLWSFQYPLIQSMRKEGYPIDGVTIAAGVPSLDVANEVVENLREAGIRHVVTIARSNPLMAIILQWTGGRAGGHHSFEDIHFPILETYSAIRAQKNIYLVLGGGFGDSKDSYSYLTGEWSTKFSYPFMPFDGILFGSRLLVAKEGKASRSVKELIVQAPGIGPYENWEETYKRPAGGIVTVNSELGEPIHKIATRGVLFWKELEDTIFRLPKEKRLPELLKKKDYIIQKLNKDCQKVWFGRKIDGQVVDIEDMTYYEVAVRLADLLFVKHQNRWIDRTFQIFFCDFLRRVEERFNTTFAPSLIQDVKDASVPSKLIDSFFGVFKEAMNQIMNSEDCIFFLNLCLNPAQKPVPFIPVMDDRFEFWFKKDSLWQSEDVDAVVDQDPQRICILQGPIAAKYSTKVDEPVSEILGNILDEHVALLKEDFYKSCEIPEEEVFQEKSLNEVGYLAGVEKSGTSESQTYQMINNANLLPSRNEWISFLSDTYPGWFANLLSAKSIVQSRKLVDNYISTLFTPKSGKSFAFRSTKQALKSVVIFDGSVMGSPNIPAVSVEISDQNILVQIFYKKPDEIISLPLKFTYQPERPYSCIQECMEDRNARVKKFYWEVWFGSSKPEAFHRLYNCNVDSMKNELTCTSKIDEKSLSKFCKIVGNRSSLYLDTLEAKNSLVPMDYAIIVSWEAVVKCLIPSFVDADLLNLVHLSNEINFVTSGKFLEISQIVETSAVIKSIKNTENGKVIEVEAISSQAGIEVLQVKSRFLCRGSFEDVENTFENFKVRSQKVVLKSEKDFALLHSKNWIKLENSSVTPGSTLLFDVSGYHKFGKNNTFSSVFVQGEIFMVKESKDLLKVGSVSYLNSENSLANPVLEYFKRHGKADHEEILFENGGYHIMPENSQNITALECNETYSCISGDFNPIHTNLYFSTIAKLPGTITHGMWTSAATRSFVETFATENHPLRLTDYSVDFEGMVLPRDQLNTVLHHIGMKNGKKIISIETFNSKGEKVIKGRALVDLPATAYVFTGQGSQEVGMGMDLYQSSIIAKEIWDRADAHFRLNYGFSIIEIVKSNPKEKTIYFGGVNGEKILKNYRNMTYESCDEEGNIKTLALFPEISDTANSYTFRSPSGLLFATQFTQPALTLMEKAAFEDMKSKGLVSNSCPFAGHSLGEYAALASIANVLTIETLVDVVFYRGMTMQYAVKRDKLGRSSYGMCAVNPSRVSKSFNHLALGKIVETISQISHGLLQIVNYNVENWQYVVAGDLINLDCLGSVLNFISQTKIDLMKVIQETSIEAVMEQLKEIVTKCLEESRSRAALNDGLIDLKRGIATIPLQGIDVPFHSSFLLNGVHPFRTYLLKRIIPSFVDVSLLEGKYIPNLIAEPFELSKEFIQKIIDVTGSSRMTKVLKSWCDEKIKTDKPYQQSIGHAILIELLAYQFASPVRWIETQDQLFKDFQIDRLIEIGPNPTLSGMAERTLKFKYEAYDDALNFRRSILCYSKHKNEIYFELEVAQEEHVATAQSPSISIPVVVETAQIVPRKTSSKISELPIKAIDVIHVMVAQKLKRSLEEVPISKSIKELVGGKSTLQNEILGDLQKEFGDKIPEKLEECSLSDASSQITPFFTGTLGKVTSSSINKLMSSKMPAGFTIASLKQYLLDSFGVENKAADSILLYSLAFEPTSRFANEIDAKKWIDTVSQFFFKKFNISVSNADSSTQSSTPMISSAEIIAMEQKEKAFKLRELQLLASYLGKDLSEGSRERIISAAKTESLQTEIEVWLQEHGEFYGENIKAIFSPLKIRKFDSYWNWVKQDVTILFYDIISGKIKNVDRDLINRCMHVMNRGHQDLLDYMEYRIYKDREVLEGSDGYEVVRNLADILINSIKDVIEKPPVYKDVSVPRAPRTTVSEEGVIKYCEVERQNVRRLSSYVQEMRDGTVYSTPPIKSHLLHNVFKLYRIVRSQKYHQKKEKRRMNSLLNQIGTSLRPGVFHIPKTHFSKKAILTPCKQQTSYSRNLPFLSIKKQSHSDGSVWEYNHKSTSTYFSVLDEIAKDGVSFADKVVLMTGCGKGSIGSEILKGLLAGGAKIVVTTSSFSRSTCEYYRGIYESVGAKDSSLFLVPFNQGSQRDVLSLINYIYDSSQGLGLDLDYIIPFAAISENGRELTEIDSKSELAHRLMLTNLLRLLGSVVSQKKNLRVESRPAQVILPLSPNHGTFGADGLYGESKIALETLFNRWHSESWKEYLTITGAVIGWTRGTGLMSDNNVIAEEIEKLGVRTFSTQEMSFNIIGLMHPAMVRMNYHEPIYADLNGGLQTIGNLNEVVKKLHSSLNLMNELRRFVTAENQQEEVLVKGPKRKTIFCEPRANFKFSYPKIEKNDYEFNEKLRDLLDLKKVVVVTGYGEVGPWGNSRTRWEMEATGKFSIEGCIEMAWIMGLVKYHNGMLKNGQVYAGWVDSATNEPVKDIEIKSKYEDRILEHSGIRIIEPELFNGYNPDKKAFLQQVVIDQDMQPLSVSKEEAESFLHQHADFVDVYEENQQWLVKFKKGASLYIPKALRFDRLVAGQIPTGWNAARYGVPKDIIEQVDPVTLFVLVSTVEALISSGITDPYELYEYVHVSEVGNTSGGGVGGMMANRKMYRGRYLDEPVQSDILQESFINTMPAWVNLLLMSSSGPIKTPVGACATAVESVEIGVDTIQSGKAKIVIVGGYDDFQEEGSFEFASMGATSNTLEEMKKGREPKEMSRPATTTRAGFMEAHGAGMQVLMSAELAIKLGCPIYGIIALTNTATDKEGRSIPAPGQGILTTAKETPQSITPRILDIEYRHAQFRKELESLNEWLKEENEFILKNSESAKELNEKLMDLEIEYAKREANLKSLWGNNFYKDDHRIASLRGALSVFGLSIDDIGVASFHGTGTKANDINESSVLNAQMKHLGRAKGNVIPAICQKYLTGHPKGAAAAWMLNGVLQVLESGIIPGNRNADNIEEKLEAFSYLMFPSHAIQTRGIKAALLKSFGFGQVGGEVLVVHPKFILSCLDPQSFDAYVNRREKRQVSTYKANCNSLTSIRPLFNAKTAPPYSEDLESAVYLNPLARAKYSDSTKSWFFDAKSVDYNAIFSEKERIASSLLNAVKSNSSICCGVDLQLISDLSLENEVFLKRNFTEAEISYCHKSADTRASFAGRWAAKEAVFKAICQFNTNCKSLGSGADLKCIEILPSSNGVPTVSLSDPIVEYAQERKISVTISHSGSYAAAVATL